MSEPGPPQEKELPLTVSVLVNGQKQDFPAYIHIIDTALLGEISPPMNNITPCAMDEMYFEQDITGQWHGYKRTLRNV